MTLKELLEKYPKLKDASLNRSEDKYLSFLKEFILELALNNDNEAIYFLFESEEIKIKPTVHLDGGKIFSYAALKENLELFKYCLNKIDHEPEETKEAKLYNKNAYLNSVYNNIVTNIMKNNDVEILKYYLSLNGNGVNVKLIDDNLIWLSAKDDHKNFKKMAEFIFYELEYKVTPQLINFFKLNAKENKSVIDIMENQLLYVQKKEFVEKLDQNLSANRSEKISKIKI